MPKAQPDEEITAQQAAEIAEVDRRTIRRWVLDEKVKGRQLPGGTNQPYLVSKQSLLTYLKSKGEQPGS